MYEWRPYQVQSSLIHRVVLHRRFVFLVDVEPFQFCCTWHLRAITKFRGVSPWLKLVEFCHFLHSVKLLAFPMCHELLYETYNNEFSYGPETVYFSQQKKASDRDMKKRQRIDRQTTKPPLAFSLFRPSAPFSLLLFFTSALPCWFRGHESGPRQSRGPQGPLQLDIFRSL